MHKELNNNTQKAKRGKCLLLINTSCGNAQRAIDNEKLTSILLNYYDDIEEIRIAEHDRDFFDIAKKSLKFSAIVVCGGDGTLNSVLNATQGQEIELIYVPCGTLNDTAHTLKSTEVCKTTDLENSHMRYIDIGEINQTLFSYVVAGGSFTAIGYKARSKTKQIFKRIVYFAHAFKEYRLHSMKAQIEMDGKKYEDIYTLIMAIKSKYVFGLRFNQLYQSDSGTGHLLLIKTPTGMFKFAQMFFLFFRAFFIGFDKEKDGKYIKFLEFTQAKIDLKERLDFCVDGEKLVLEGHAEIKFHKKAIKVLLV
jgi:diacylglycerol kinase (ATP)